MIKRSNIRNVFCLLLIVGLFSSCDWPQEDPNLVDPPAVAPSIGIRYFNLSGGGEPRTFVMNFETEVQDIPFNNISAQLNPPADSTYISINKSNGQLEYQRYAPIKYIVRNINYTFISIETKKGSKDTLYQETDSIVYFQSTMITPRNPTDAYIRLFNGVNDSTKYLVKKGCSNGTTLLSSLSYGDIQLQAKTVFAGIVPVSIIKQYKDRDSIIGVYSLPIERLGQYTIMILPSHDKQSQDIYLYDELTQEIEAIQPVEEVLDKYAETRIINISYANISVRTGSDEIVTDNLAPLTISDYTAISACISQTSDLILFESEGEVDTNAISLGVLEQYTYVNIDSADIRAYTQVLVPPLELDFNLGDNCLVQVVNGYWKENSSSVYMGLREVNSGLITGEAIAKSLPFGELSTYYTCPSGRAPLSLFSATQPAHLLYNCITELEAGESYILLIHADENGNPKLALINERNYSTAVTFLEEGIYTNIVSVVTNTPETSVTISANGETIISDCTIPQSNSITTVLPVGSIDIIANNMTKTIISEDGKRLLVILSGSLGNEEIFNLSYPGMETGSDFYSRRFFNASNDVATIYIREDQWEDEDDDSPQIHAEIDRGTVSYPSNITLEAKKSFFIFDDPIIFEPVAQINDLIFSFNKSYTIIIAGDVDNGYFGSILQEY